MEQEVAEEIRQFVLNRGLSNSVYTVPTSKRYYPHGSLAAKMIGWVNWKNDNKGAYGMEALYETELAGQMGRVVTAKDGKAAVDAFTASPPRAFDCILMDLMMPVMSGYDAARAIRALEDKRLARIPIIAMTANVFEEDKQEALKAGMNGHIAKPIDTDVLFETLDKILG